MKKGDGNRVGNRQEGERKYEEINCEKSLRKAKAENISPFLRAVHMYDKNAPPALTPFNSSTPHETFLFIFSQKNRLTVCKTCV